MTEQYIWIDSSNLDYEKMPYRRGYASERGIFEYPVDRFGLTNGLLEIPGYNILPNPIYNFTNLTPDFEDRFYSLLDSTADEVYKAAGNNKIIHLLYSGGVDSVCIFIALIKHPNYKEFLAQNRFKISMTSLSIDEFPELFYSVILPSIPIEVLDYNALMKDDNILLVVGDLGDNLIGNNDSLSILNGDSSFNLMSQWTSILSYFNNIDKTFIELCTILNKSAPFEINSVNQFLWWIPQCLAFQVDIVRPYIWSDIEDYTLMATNNKVFRFFFTESVQTFSYEYMSTNPLYKTCDSIRTWHKKYIIHNTHIPSYMSKIKVYSQRNTLRFLYKTRLYIKDNIIKSELTSGTYGTT